MAANSEILNHYNDLSDAQLLLRFGFVEGPQNPHNNLPMTFSLPSSHLFDIKMRLLNVLGIAAPQYTATLKMGGTIPTELVYLASVMRMDDRQDIERAIAMKRIPVEIQDASVDGISAALRTMLSQYVQGSNVPGTDSTDKVPSQRQQNLLAVKQERRPSSPLHRDIAKKK